MPFTTASGWGYHVHPPIGFKVRWDGHQMFWRYGDIPGWLPLTQAQLPGQRAFHEAQAPEGSRRFSPTFLEAFPEPGILQIWSGYVVRTAPDWSLFVRSPINLPASPFYEVVEAIIETDWWIGPLVTNLRITKTDVPIEFRRAAPLFHIAPVPRLAYTATDRGQGISIVDAYEEWPEEEWSRFQEVFESRNSGSPGDYGRIARKRPPPPDISVPDEQAS